MIGVKRFLHLLGFGCAVLLGGEGAARLDDWFRHDVSPLASPNRERDLVMTESWGSRGRPNGRYRKWKLDASGFRAIPTEPKDASEGSRLLILGASETFGLYESPGKEYPAQLAHLLRKNRPCQVVNASLAGINLKSLTAYWDHWARNFHANQVLIYPPSHFYLDTEPPTLPKNPAGREGNRSRIVFRPRLLDRMQDVYHRLPGWVKVFREDWVIRQETAGKDDDWFFTTVPEERVKLFADDLETLIAHVRACGVEPILLTHAMSATSPPRPEDEAYLRGMRMFLPRPSAETIAAFEQRANAVIRDTARKDHLALIDVDRALSGKRELFADLVHFNDEGAAKIAELIAEQLPPGQSPETAINCRP